jgi:hypothetical protein
MRKRGQLTLFIILAIILFLGIIFYYFQSTSKDSLQDNFIKDRGLTKETSLIRSNIFRCIDSSYESALVHIGIQGGHNKAPELYFTNKDLQEYNAFFSYFYYQGNYLMPEIETIEESFSVHMEKSFSECLNNQNYPLNTSFSTPRIITNIKEERIDIKIDLKITIEQKGIYKTVDLKDETFSYPSRLYHMIEIAEYLTNYHKIDPQFFCINCLKDMAHQRGINVNVVSFSEEKTRQVVMFEEKQLSPHLYIFTYLNKYTGEEKSPLFDEE